MSFLRLLLIAMVAVGALALPASRGLDQSIEVTDGAEFDGEDCEDDTEDDALLRECALSRDYARVRARLPLFDEADLYAHLNDDKRRKRPPRTS